MARIIFGVQGEGMGHAMRSAILIEHLLKKNKIKIFAGNRAYKYLSSKFKDVNKIESQNIAYKDNKANILGTIGLNLKKSKKFMESYSKIKKAIKSFKADIIITDYEAITNLAARSSKCRHISIDNQNDVTFLKSNPKLKELFSYRNTRDVTKLFTAGADVYLIYSIDGRKDTKKRKYLGNLIKDKIRKQKAKYGDHIFVYQTSKSNTKLLDILKETDEKYVIYGFNKDKKDKNITFRKFNDTIYYRDFSQCKAIIAGGGLTTITEAIYLKKPILSIPIKGQFEQVFNARTIEGKGFGMEIEEADKDKIDEFLKNLEKYKKNLEKYKGMSNEEILKKIDKVISSG